MEELIYLANLWEKNWYLGKKLREEYEQLGSFKKIWELENEELDENILGRYEGEGIRLLAFWDPLYPKELKQMIGRPTLLYVKGDEMILNRRLVAIVGTREPGELAKEKVNRATDILGEMVIVSGLAKGVDRLAHEEALRRGWPTVAVLAHGLKMVYPAENMELAKMIIKSGGALVSEFPLEVGPRPRYFLERNRIVVGMSEAVVVIEAELKSGSMNSANLGAEMGKDVFAVEGSPLTDLLIDEGAEGITLGDGNSK